jgi:hypothetical protein
MSKYILIEPDRESKFVSPKKTTPHGINWHCANVPYKVKSNNGVDIVLVPFNRKSTITIRNEIFETEYYHLESDVSFVYIPGYPDGKVAISEFDIKPISIKKLEKHFEGNTNILKALDKAKHDSFNAKGNNNCIKIDDYNKYKAEPKTIKLERIGDPIFNRSVRHSPPISKTITREDFDNSPSFPAPIGIREEDFALPSEQNEILIELLNQIFSCKNSPECPEEIISELGLTINSNSHMCSWCGEIMDISELNQEYCSKEHSINFCHRIPELGTKKGNVYIGHCSCNREQGGYSEEQRIEQFICLAKTNPSYIEKILQSLA